MKTLTIRLPDSTAERLETLARSRGLSLDELIEALSTQAIAAFDAEARFRALASRGDCAAALAVLDRLDSAAGDSGARP
jgi:predicted transcriptional regulator